MLNNRNINVSGKPETISTARRRMEAVAMLREKRDQARQRFGALETGRTLHPDNMAAGPASYGMTDTMGRMHSDAQFAGSSGSGHR